MNLFVLKLILVRFWDFVFQLLVFSISKFGLFFFRIKPVELSVMNAFPLMP